MKKKSKCLICGDIATIKKEVLIAIEGLYGTFKSTNKLLDFCTPCYNKATPVFIIE
jgi:hypothetical protein